MPRLARVVAPGYAHHVTQRGTNHGIIFADDEDRRKFLFYLGDWAPKTRTRVWAYCLMNNHFHLLLVPETETSLSKCLHGVTFLYAQNFNERHQRSGRFWQNRFFSCPVDTDSYLWTAARYIERNPVRAGFVETPDAWNWSSARAHMFGRKDPTLTSPDWLEDHNRQDYRDFVRASGAEDEVRSATSTGRPMGKIDFYRKLEAQLGRSLCRGKAGRPKRRQ
jgi:putative transposase